MSNNSMQFLSGNEAFARGAWEAGVRVAAAYPGTPSTEILEAVATYADIDAQWSVNEKVAFEVTYGAAIAGARSLCACKHVGLNVAMDPLMTSVYTGIGAGMVIIVADDPGMHSSQNEQDTRWVGPYAKIPVLEPSSPAEAREYVKAAFALSEQFDTPVIVRSTTRISHSKENVTPGGRDESPRATYAPDWAKYVMVPANARKRHALVEERLVALKAMAETSPLNRVERGDTKLGFITSCVSYQYVKERYPDASVLKLGITYPLCTDLVRSFVASVDEALVVEELDPFLETMIKAAGISVRGKHASYCLGEIKPEYLPAIVDGTPKNDPPRPSQPPSLCKGCPHRLSFKALGELGLVVAGDIGCYTLGALPPFSALHTCLCMGAGVTAHEGMRRALGGEAGRVVGVLGDSTFVHSGITGLINAAYNRQHGLILILDNATTAMTGGQNHPANGLTIRNQATRQLCLEDICRACGADNVDVIRPQEYQAMKELIARRAGEQALSVIIVRSPCILMRPATA